jgi:hypothetical protein
MTEILSIFFEMTQIPSIIPEIPGIPPPTCYVPEAIS